MAGLVGGGPPDRPASCSSGWTTATTRRWCASPASARVVATADFFTPVVDDAVRLGPDRRGQRAVRRLRDGRHARSSRSTCSAGRGTCCPCELAAEVLRGGLDVARRPAATSAGGHSVDDPEPKYGMAVTGIVDLGPAAAQRRRRSPGMPLTLTKPLGVGVLNSRHKATGEVFAEAVDVDDRAQPRRRRPRSPPGVRAATDVTGFGLLGHLLQAGAGQRGHRGRGRRRGARTWTAPARRWPTASSPAAPGATSTGCGRTPTCGASPRTRRCCSPTRRPPAGCWWPARCPGTR